MDEQLEKIIALAGNNNRYQYFTLVVITFLWVNCNFISTIIPFIEREPLINYYDKDGNYHESETLTNEICDLYKERGQELEILERFRYSWVSEYNIECEKMDIGLIGAFIYVGNTAGAVVFSIVSKITTHKKILIISSFGFCIVLFLNTLITSYSFFYCSLACLVLLGTFGNCLCYSSIVLAEEIVRSDKRSLFSGVINVGYSLSGVLYSIAFWFIQDWRIVFYICIFSSIISLILIWVFIYDSPRTFINKKDYENTMRILEGIASFNGKLELFKESIEDEEYRDTICSIKGINPEIKNEDNDNEEQKNINNNENNENENNKDENNENENDKDDNKKENNNDENENNENNENKEGDKENINIDKENIERESNKDYTDTKQNINSASEGDTNLNTNKDTKDDKDDKENLNEPLIGQSPPTDEKKSKIQNINIWSLFKYPSIRLKFIILNMLWLGTRFVFNGISISSKSFRGNFYLNIIILFTIESIAYCTLGFVIDIKGIGRKGSLWILFFLVVVALIILTIFKLDITPELILNYLIRFCAAGIEVVFYTYSIEIYPTLVRSVAFGVNLTFGNGGSIIAPLILEYLNYWLILTVFAVINGISSLLLFFLPETVGKPMIESIPELEE